MREPGRERVDQPNLNIVKVARVSIDFNDGKCGLNKVFINIVQLERILDVLPNVAISV